MGRWAARYAEKLAAPPQGGTDKTDERGVLSVLAVAPERGACEFQAVPMAASKPTESPAALDLAAVAWTDSDIARFLDRRARLLRWGWAADDAEKLADRMVRRDREHDERVSCTDCRHYRPGRCDNHERALLSSPELGRDFATQLQRCAGYSDSFQ